MYFIKRIGRIITRRWAIWRWRQLEQACARQKETLADTARGCSPRQQKTTKAAHLAGIQTLDAWLARRALSTTDITRDPMFQCVAFSRNLRETQAARIEAEQRAAWIALCARPATDYRRLIKKRGYWQRRLGPLGPHKI